MSFDETNYEGETKDKENEVDNLEGEKKEGGSRYELDNEDGQKEANKLFHDEDQSSKEIIAMRQKIESVRQRKVNIS